MKQEITGPQILLIEIVKLQMKMGEALAITTGRVSALEAFIASAPLDTELKMVFTENLQKTMAAHDQSVTQIRDQVAQVVSELERYMNNG